MVVAPSSVSTSTAGVSEERWTTRTEALPAVAGPSTNTSALIVATKSDAATVYFLPAATGRSVMIGQFASTVPSLPAAQTRIAYVAGGDREVVAEAAEGNVRQDLAAVGVDVHVRGIRRGVEDADHAGVSRGHGAGDGEEQGAGGDEAGEAGGAHGQSLR